MSRSSLVTARSLTETRQLEADRDVIEALVFDDDEWLWLCADRWELAAQFRWLIRSTAAVDGEAT